MAAVVVVGGGITGLAAAHRLVENGVADVLVLEASGAAGGQIRTERHGEYLLEGGPDALVAQKPEGVALCRRLGLGDDLREVQNSGTQIWHRGRLHRVPDGFLMMAPTRMAPVLRSGLFSWRGKLRMARERFVPARAQGVDDESLASFVTRRFGREVLDRVAEPVIAGLFTADAERLSLRMTMPTFLELEAREGSVTRGLRGRRPFGHGTGRGGFLSVAPGFKRVVEALISRLPEGRVRTGARVVSVSETTGGAWSVKLSGGETIPAGAVVVACPGEGAAAAVLALDSSLAGTIRRLRYASCATVNIVYKRGDVRARLQGNGFFVPRTEKLPILACSYVSEKMEGRAPAGMALFRAFLGGALHPSALHADDATLTRITNETLRRILGITSDPVLAVVHRSPSAMPQYEVGSKDLVGAIRERADAHPGLFLAGSVAGAFGLPDCIRSGEDAAERASAYLATSARVAYQANQKA